VKILPNLLSAARLALAPFLFMALWRREYGFALGLCFVAGITDAFDGLLARWLKASSKIGAYLDPIADKVLLSGAFLTLALDGAIEKWVAVIVFGRDLLILAMAAGAFALTSIRSFPPTWWGKASTTAQIAYILALLLHFVGFFPLALVELGKWIVVVLGVWSGVHYVWVAAWMVRRERI
jgi:cardiolipin synthase